MRSKIEKQKLKKQKEQKQKIKDYRIKMLFESINLLLVNVDQNAHITTEELSLIFRFCGSKTHLRSPQRGKANGKLVR